jgi:class 3 adenylate cyclase
MSELIDVRSEKFAQTFIEERMLVHQELISEANVIVIAFYAVVCFFVDLAVARPEYMMPLHVLRICMLASACSYYWIRARYPRLGRAWIGVLHLVTNGAFTFFLYDSLRAGDLGRAAIPAAVVTCQAVFLVAASPYNSLTTALSSLGQFALIGLACSSNFGVYFRYLIIAGMAIACANLYHRTLISWTIVSAKLELESRLKVAPHDLVRRSIGSETLLADALKPQSRYCVCLASDWRGYQSVSRERTPEALSTALGGYYEVCRALLDQHFPRGNFYSDWIADELLIFFIPEEGGTHEQLAVQVLGFARELLRAKQVFAARVGLPRAIDIGIAAGVAVVGLSGPASHRKVMAIGQVPVRARKMQSLGKELRRAQGERDRVIFAASFAPAPAAEPMPASVVLPELLRADQLVVEEASEVDATSVPTVPVIGA